MESVLPPTRVRLPAKTHLEDDLHMRTPHREVQQPGSYIVSGSDGILTPRNHNGLSPMSICRLHVRLVWNLDVINYRHCARWYLGELK